MRFPLLVLLCPLVLSSAGCVMGPAASAVEAASTDEHLPVHVEGSSFYGVTGACAPIVPYCAGQMRWNPGELRVAGTSSTGTLRLEWEDQPGSTNELHVSVDGRGGAVARAFGTSPLELQVPPLEKGTYEVRIAPEAAVGAVEFVAAWVFHAEA